MCGRYTSTVDAETLAERFGAAVPPGYRRRFNTAPTQEVLAVRPTADGAREAAFLRWGLVPAWSKDPNAYRLINARAETVLEKPAYRSLVRSSRCLIPADGFYEWRRARDGGKDPVRFSLADASVFAFAGLWTRKVFAETGEVLDSCTILTTAANDLVRPVHDRMPVMLPADAEAVWLDAATPVERALELLLPYPADAMRAEVVSRRVNSAAEDDPSLLEPVSLAA